jgi:dimethylamine corrinoid protein
MKVLIKALADLNERQVLSEVKIMKQRGVAVRNIIRDLQEGMCLVGEQFEAKNYYLPELIMPADIFKQAVEFLSDAFTEVPEESKYGTFVIGTVSGDIHDISKNIVAALLGCNGFKVIDLGVNVPTSQFLETIRKQNPRFVGLSCLLTTAFESMKATIKEIERAGLRKRLSILIGGAPVTKATCNYLGADAFCLNAHEGVDTARRMAGA